MKTNRDIETRRRNRKGQLIAECEHCTCPDGCACEGVPHGCGRMKKPKAQKGVRPMNPLPCCRECGAMAYQPTIPGQPKEVLQSAGAVALHCRKHGFAKQEKFRVIALDIRLAIVKEKVIAVGSMVACPVDPAEVFRWLLKIGASRAIVVHNHPSGNPEPSVEDNLLTTRLRVAGDLIGITILDHVIVARGTHFSYRESAQW